MDEKKQQQNTNKGPDFLKMVIGTEHPVSIPMETVKVNVSADDMVKLYAEAFVAEAWRINPLKMEQLDLSKEEVVTYCDFLLYQRCMQVNNDCKIWRKLKALYIPAFVQHAISLIGEVNLRMEGLKLVPKYAGDEKKVLSFEEALKISEKIGSLEDDMCVLRDAMPRGIEGNVDVMSTALVSDYVRALKPVEHIAYTYVTAFLNMKLAEETAFKALYRVQYDDVGFIVNTLSTQKGLFR